MKSKPLKHKNKKQKQKQQKMTGRTGINPSDEMIKNTSRIENGENNEMGDIQNDRRLERSDG